MIVVVPVFILIFHSSTYLSRFVSLGVGVALKQALTPEYKVYQQEVVDNCRALCKSLQDKGYTIVSGKRL